MAVIKEWFQRMRPLRVCIILVLTLAFFLVQLLVSHLTHALTLLMDAYHMLCNVITLSGCMVTVKDGNTSCNVDKQNMLTSSETEELKVLSTPLGSVKFAPKNCPQPERELRNTFGWARVDILVMLIGCVFMASFCFSLVVEAAQTLVHISHHDEMHHPIPVFCLGVTGLFLNHITYLMIGGYTFHQGSFLHVTESGDVVLEPVNDKSVSNGQRRLSSQTRRVRVPLQPPKRQGILETCRDIVGSLIVILCSIIVYFTEQDVAKYVDPLLSIVSALLLLSFSFPYMKESCLILLQTIPDHINIDSLKSELLSAFPEIVNVHDFHIWQLTVNKTFSTVHIIFLNPQVYCRIMDDITTFFHCHGITHVTVQPEFFKHDLNSMDLVSGYGSAQCLVQCVGDGCLESRCCSTHDLHSISVNSIPKMVNKEAAIALSIKPITEGEHPAVHQPVTNRRSCISLGGNESPRESRKSHSITNGCLTKSITLPDIREGPGKVNNNTIVKTSAENKAELGDLTEATTDLKFTKTESESLEEKVIENVKTNNNGHFENRLENLQEIEIYSKSGEKKVKTEPASDSSTKTKENLKEENRIHPKSSYDSEIDNNGQAKKLSNFSNIKDVEKGEPRIEKAAHLRSQQLNIVVQNECKSTNVIVNPVVSISSTNVNNHQEHRRKHDEQMDGSELKSSVIVHRFETDC